MNPRELGYYVHHHGAGHVTRAVEITRHLSLPVTGLSSLPRPPGWCGEWIELPRDDTPAAGSTRDAPGWVEADAGGAVHWAPLEHAGYRKRMRIVAEWVTHRRPDLVIIDVSVEVTLLVRLLGVPVAVAAMRGDRDDPAHRSAYAAARLLFAPWPAPTQPDTKPPGTARSARTVHVGGISRFDDLSKSPAAGAVIDTPAPTYPAGNTDIGAGTDPDTATDSRVITPSDPPAPERLVAVLWGRGGGDWTEAQRRAARDATPSWRWVVAGEDCDVWTTLQEAAVVVCHAGQNAVAEVAAARRPAIVVAIDRPHDEQRATVEALAHADLAETRLGLPAPHEWPALLERAAWRDGQAWRTWSDGFGGFRAARAIEAAAHKRQFAARTAVLTLVHGRYAHLRGLLAGLAAGTHRPERVVVVALGDPLVAAVCTRLESRHGIPIELIEAPLPDGADLPLAGARNAAAARATALGCTTLIFLDVDCIPGPTLVATYARAVEERTRTAPDSSCDTPADAAASSPEGDPPSDAAAESGVPGPTVWAGGVAYLPPAPMDGYDLAALPTSTRPHPARPAPPAGTRERARDLRLFWSLSFAMSATDFAAVGGFDEAYVGYGGEDTDFAMRLGATGGSLWWLGGADAFHQHHPTQTPPLQHLHDIVRNPNLFAHRWGWHPMESWLAAFADAGLARLDPVSGQWRVT